jgi:hypothetical protein
MGETLFDVFIAEEERDKALARVESHADDEWKKIALTVIRDIAIDQLELTTDDVWLALAERDCATHEPRALGAVMRRAAAVGIIERTDVTRRSVRSTRHRGDVRVWKSLL